MGGCLRIHIGLHRGSEQRPLSYGMAQANVGLALPAWLHCPFLPGDPTRCPRLLLPLVCLPKEDFCSTFSGGKQPVTVGLLWIQQTAFVSPNSETLQKATEWAGDCFLGREPQVWAQWWEEATLCTRTYSCVCSLWDTHINTDTYFQTSIHTHTRARTHAHTHARTHACTHPLGNPIAVRSQWLSALDSKYIQVSTVGFLQNAL